MVVLYVSGHRQMSDSESDAALVQRVLMMMATRQNHDIARTAGKAYT